MLYKIARRITTEYLRDLSFADRTGGLVMRMNDSRTTPKSYPVEINQDKELGDNQYMRRLVPDTNLKSLMYWEQRTPPTVTKEHNKWYECEASLSLVVWFSYLQVDPDMKDPAYLIAQIVNAIPFKVGNYQCLAAITCSYAGQDSNDGSIFTKYTYNEPNSQFFKYPYDYFVLNFDVSYRVVADCEEKNLTSLPVAPVMLYVDGNEDKIFRVYGVSGREAQLIIYSANNIILYPQGIFEFSGEYQDFEFSPVEGFKTIIKLDYGREYLRAIDMPDQGVYQFNIPSDYNIRLEYVDLSGNNISSTFLGRLISHAYNSEVNNGYIDVSGGTNDSIVSPITLGQIATLVDERGWEINYNE
jgi:hypothetical protein